MQIGQGPNDMQDHWPSQPDKTRSDVMSTQEAFHARAHIEATLCDPFHQGPPTQKLHKRGRTARRDETLSLDVRDAAQHITTKRRVSSQRTVIIIRSSAELTMDLFVFRLAAPLQTPR